jgi:hypothetical protein
VGYGWGLSSEIVKKTAAARISNNRIVLDRNFTLAHASGDSVSRSVAVAWWRFDRPGCDIHSCTGVAVWNSRNYDQTLSGIIRFGCRWPVLD